VRVEEVVRLEVLGKKKHPAFDQFDQAAQTLIQSFLLIEPEQDLEKVKAKTSPALQFYKDAVINYSEKDKDEAKLKHICLYNLALTHYWQEEFDLAAQYAKEILSMDSKDKDASKLLEEIARTLESMQKSGRSSRHAESIISKS
jgi:tetratricopeptide (TPR) repeat protein